MNLRFVHGSITMPLIATKVKSSRLGPTPGAGQPFTVEDLLAAWLIPGLVRTTPASGLQAVLFDLDGVLVDTAELHYRAWQNLADELGLPFDRRRNEAFRGVGRMECLDKLLGRHARTFAPEEKVLLADRKNAHYLEAVSHLTSTDVAPGAPALIMQLRAAGLRLALVSASRNARRVLERLGITDWFDCIVDGSQVTRSKPDPQGFLRAAERLAILPQHCVVIEDADAGLQAARAGGMKAVAIAEAGSHTAELGDLAVREVGDLRLDLLAGLVPATITPAA